MYYISHIREFILYILDIVYNKYIAYIKTQEDICIIYTLHIPTYTNILSRVNYLVLRIRGDGVKGGTSIFNLGFVESQNQHSNFRIPTGRSLRRVFEAWFNNYKNLLFKSRFVILLRNCCRYRNHFDSSPARY